MDVMDDLPEVTSEALGLVETFEQVARTLRITTQAIALADTAAVAMDAGDDDAMKNALRDYIAYRDEHAQPISI